jgi:hypothetical protein
VPTGRWGRGVKHEMDQWDTNSMNCVKWHLIWLPAGSAIDWSDQLGSVNPGALTATIGSFRWIPPVEP